MLPENPRVVGSVGTLFIATAVGPMVLKRLDVLARTMSVDRAGILLRAAGVGSAENPAILVGTLYAVGLIVGSCGIGHAMRARAREAHRHLHLQAWQLRQLVPR